MSSPLSEYNRKRNFERTPEPPGTVDESTRPDDAAEQGRLRFAVQHHRASRDHYDLRLEWNGTLLSWAVPKGPSYNPRDKRLAVRVEDHPLDYRTFEGVIAQGEYGGGTVMLWDEGYWEPLVDVEDGLADGDLKFVLDGHRLHGAWVLVHMKPKKGERDNNWLLIKEKDGDEVVCQTASFTVNVTEEEPEEPGLIKSEEELRSAIAKGGTVELEDGADIVLTSQLTISNAVTIKAGTNAKIRAEGTMRSFGDSIVTVSGVNANFENVAIDAGDQAEYALTYTDGASGTLTGVTVSGGTGSDLLVDGANVTLGSGTSAGQTELAKTGSGTPKLAVQSGSSTKVWVDHDTYTALGMSEDDLEEQLAALVSAESGTVEAVVGTQPGSSAENGTPVTVQPDDADGGDEDDGEESQPEEKTSRTGGDYFGNQKWAELKAQIAKAEDGDTIEMSGTGLPWFPSSVARELKGRDITLKIRKNGVTYTLNGEKIGLITKLWYNFDENLESTLQPVQD